MDFKTLILKWRMYIQPLFVAKYKWYVEIIKLFNISYQDLNQKGHKKIRSLPAIVENIYIQLD